MTFHRYGKTAKFPRDEHVEIHVREVTLNASAPASAQVQMVDIREFIREGEVYGHGVLIPIQVIPDLDVALDQLGVRKAKGCVQRG